MNGGRVVYQCRDSKVEVNLQVTLETGEHSNLIFLPYKNVQTGILENGKKICAKIRRALHGGNRQTQKL